MLKNDFELHPRKTNWCSQLKDLLCSLGLVDAWIFQGVGNVDMFLYLVKQRLNDQFIQNWNARLSDSSRALFYRNIASFKCQSYLDCFNVRKCCQALTRLRVSSHRLHIESGRWSRPERTPMDERKCTVCNKLEDEYHFIIECRMFLDIRKLYIQRKYWCRPSMNKFIELITSENKIVIRKLGMFIYNAFAVRTTLLYVN